MPIISPKKNPRNLPIRASNAWSAWGLWGACSFRPPRDGRPFGSQKTAGLAWQLPQQNVGKIMKKLENIRIVRIDQNNNYPKILNLTPWFVKWKDRIRIGHFLHVPFAGKPISIQISKWSICRNLDENSLEHWSYENPGKGVAGCKLRSTPFLKMTGNQLNLLEVLPVVAYPQWGHFSHQCLKSTSMIPALKYYISSYGPKNKIQ